MDRNFKRALSYVLKHEGGYVDHPRDPGGATNKGVTLATLRRYVKADATKDDLRKITDAQVSTVYYRHYWAAVQAHQLPAGVDYAVFDFGVNSGPARAVKFLQKIVGVKADGRVGPETLKAVAAMEPERIIRTLCANRLAWLKRLKGWSTFGRGWERRVNDVKRDALIFVGDPADVEIVTKDKPIVPKTIDAQVKQKSSWWERLTGGLFGAGGVGAAIMGVDWQTIVAIGVTGVVVVGGIIIFRRQIINTIKDVRRVAEA